MTTVYFFYSLEQAKSRHSSPSIFVGTFVGGTCLLIAAFTYGICRSSIQMSGRMKHALANTWLAIASLAIVFRYLQYVQHLLYAHINSFPLILLPVYTFYIFLLLALEFTRLNT